MVVAVEIGERIRQLGLIPIAIGNDLIELGLIGTRIDFGERVAGLFGLSFCEGYLRYLPLDLASYDDCVIGDDRSDAAQIDWDIAAGNGAGDDRYRRTWQRRSRFPSAPMDQDEHTGDGEDDDNRASENCSSWSHQPSSEDARF